jgi:hypothetical protein
MHSGITHIDIFCQIKAIVSFLPKLLKLEFLLLNKNIQAYSPMGWISKDYTDTQF